MSCYVPCQTSAPSNSCTKAIIEVQFPCSKGGKGDDKGGHACKSSNDESSPEKVETESLKISVPYPVLLFRWASARPLMICPGSCKLLPCWTPSLQISAAPEGADSLSVEPVSLSRSKADAAADVRRLLAGMLMEMIQGASTDGGRQDDTNAHEDGDAGADYSVFLDNR